MNAKKVNWLFLVLLLVQIAFGFLLVLLRSLFSIDMVTALVLGELVIIMPALIVLLVSKDNKKELLSFRRIKISSALMVVLCAYLFIPLTTLLNAVSMLFVENEVASAYNYMSDVPFSVLFLVIAVWGPLCEEITFRGVVHGGYRRSLNAWQAMLWSALLFGLFHLNFNQAPYAFALGIIFALLKEATGSIWAPLIAHMVVNGNSTVLMKLSEMFLSVSGGTAATETVSELDAMLATIGFLAVVAAAATTLGICVLVWIAKNEKRGYYLRNVLAERKMYKGKSVNVPLIIGIILAAAYMTLNVILA